MRRALGLLLAVAPFVFAAAEDEIRQVLRVQTEAWNRGDIPAFVQYYAADAVFVGRSVSVTHGSADVKARYLREYPTRERMGVLTFSDLEIRLLSPSSAYVIGRYHLDRSAASGGPASGLFSLVFAKRNAQWLIVLDHTS
jgi:uncharacterized protein (TIGR02246 family)